MEQENEWKKRDGYPGYYLRDVTRVAFPEKNYEQHRVLLIVRPTIDWKSETIFWNYEVQLMRPQHFSLHLGDSGKFHYPSNGQAMTAAQKDFNDLLGCGEFGKR